MKLTKFKTKDFVIIGIIVTIYTVLSMIASGVGQLIAPILGEVIIKNIFVLLFGGVIILFLINKVPKFGILTIFSTIYIGIWMLFGFTYLPYILSIVLSAVLADFIANISQYQNQFQNAIAFAITQSGSVLGGLIPAMFFADSYSQALKTMNMTDELIQANIKFYTGYAGIIVLATYFFAAFFGIYFGYVILSKHFKK